MKISLSLIFRTVLLMLPAASAHAAFVTRNTGSLGSAADGSSADGVGSMAGAVLAGGDQAALYPETAGIVTTVPYQSSLNPSAPSPFSIEFWAYPTETDGDDSPLSNRVGSGNRSGWVFFQRPETEGWNFRMYNGVGSAVGWDLTGGTATLNTWSHVVATWNGSSAQLYVNGVLVDDSNTGSTLNPAPDGVYNASTTATLFTATSDTSSLFKGGVDEVAFYASVLSSTQVGAHYTAATSPTAGTYHQLIRDDGALLQLSNNAVPEPAALGFLGLAGLGALANRRRNQTAF